MKSSGNNQTLTNYKLVVQSIGIVRTGFSLATIFQNSHSWDTMPFISPLLWLDWVTVYSLCDYYLPKLAVIPGVIGACLYVVCVWLTVGYGILGMVFASTMY
jgi:hypothetical protein